MLDGLAILIVEDEIFVALDLAAAVEDCGGMVIGPVATVAEAMALLEQQDAAAAILDAQLLDRDVTPLAIRLVQRGMPFVVHTGTGLPDALKAHHPDLPVIRKPASTAYVVQELVRQMARSPGGPMEPPAEEITACLPPT